MGVRTRARLLRCARNDRRYSSLVTEPIDNRVFVLVLQHPQERREALSTAPLLCATLRHAKLAIGLSWRGRARAVGGPAEPKRWAVLHLGAARPGAQAE